MQRNFSVDDILGTFWKLDTQGDAKSPVAILEEEPLSRADPQRAAAPFEGGAVVDKGMNRSASEYAFQEFLKVSESGSGFARQKSRFMLSEDIHEDDDDDDDEDEDDPDPTSPESPPTSENNTDSRQEEAVCDLNAVPPPPSPPIVPKQEEVVRAMSGVVDQVEVGGALNPLFSGIRDEVESAATTTNSPQEYEYFLKHKLDMACAAVALSRASAGGAKVGPPALQANNAPEAYYGGMAPSAVRGLGGSPIGIPALPPKPEFGVPMPPTRTRDITSGSDGSDDDDLDGEMGQNVAPGDLKRVKRMLSNRESARRSRRRKQAHLSELESQVAQLRVENSTIVKRLTEITLKFQQAVIENRALKEDVTALQAKLKMAQNMVAGTANGQAGSMDAPKPGSRYMMQYAAVGNNGPHYPHRARPGPVAPPPPQQQLPHGATGGKMGRTPSMQRVASLEHLQKRIRGGSVACNAPAWGGGGGGAYWEAEGPPSMVEQQED